MGGHFLGGISTIVALFTKIMALFLKKILAAFWRFLAQNVALPNSKQLDTLNITNVASMRIAKTRVRIAMTSPMQSKARGLLPCIYV